MCAGPPAQPGSQTQAQLNILGRTVPCLGQTNITVLQTWSVDTAHLATSTGSSLLSFIICCLLSILLSYCISTHYTRACTFSSFAVFQFIVLFATFPVNACGHIHCPDYLACMGRWDVLTNWSARTRAYMHVPGSLISSQLGWLLPVQYVLITFVFAKINPYHRYTSTSAKFQTHG